MSAPKKLFKLSFLQVINPHFQTINDFFSLNLKNLPKDLREPFNGMMSSLIKGYQVQPVEVQERIFETCLALIEFISLLKKEFTPLWNEYVKRNLVKKKDICFIDEDIIEIICSNAFASFSEMCTPNRHIKDIDRFNELLRKLFQLDNSITISGLLDKIPLEKHTDFIRAYLILLNDHNKRGELEELRKTSIYFNEIILDSKFIRFAWLEKNDTLFREILKWSESKEKKIEFGKKHQLQKFSFAFEDTLHVKSIKEAEVRFALIEEYIEPEEDQKKSKKDKKELGENKKQYLANKFKSFTYNIFSQIDEEDKKIIAKVAAEIRDNQLWSLILRDFLVTNPLFEYIFKELKIPREVILKSLTEKDPVEPHLSIRLFLRGSNYQRSILKDLIKTDQQSSNEIDAKKPRKRANKKEPSLVSKLVTMILRQWGLVANVAMMEDLELITLVINQAKSNEENKSILFKGLGVKWLVNYALMRTSHGQPNPDKELIAKLIELLPEMKIEILKLAVSRMTDAAFRANPQYCIQQKDIKFYIELLEEQFNEAIYKDLLKNLYYFSNYLLFNAILHHKAKRLFDFVWRAIDDDTRLQFFCNIYEYCPNIDLEKDSLLTQAPNYSVIHRRFLAIPRLSKRSAAQALGSEVPQAPAPGPATDTTPKGPGKVPRNETSALTAPSAAAAKGPAFFAAPGIAPPSGALALAQPKVMMPEQLVKEIQALKTQNQNLIAENERQGKRIAEFEAEKTGNEKRIKELQEEIAFYKSSCMTPHMLK